MKDKIFIAATNNKNKLREISEILKKIGYTTFSMKDVGIDCHPEETGNSFLENALIKAKAIRKMTDLPIISDDSGISVDYLGGMPGVHTSRYSGENSTDDSNILKLLNALEGVEKPKRTARFISAVVVLMPDGQIITSMGRCEGYIGFEKRGNNGFGYDPIFYLSRNISFAELEDYVKNSISHRARALRKICFKLKKIDRMELLGYDI
ncbi:MAG: RdgB/HAM1 family non-canonical purine NTP pyrophosphatase [Ruminococcaceae bacterium]|nr:RdgB/HAM1 family non-canonical purine NTP pyrophosphatase [Oscillospiraceae bacterium]